MTIVHKKMITFSLLIMLLVSVVGIRESKNLSLKKTKLSFDIEVLSWQLQKQEEQSSLEEITSEELKQHLHLLTLERKFLLENIISIQNNIDQLLIEIKTIEGENS